MKKRNLLKRVAALAMSAMMVLGMTATTSAAPTINETTGSLTIEKYVKTTEGDTSRPIEGVEFKYIKVGDFVMENVTTNPDDPAKYVEGFTLDASLAGILNMTAGTTYDGQKIQTTFNAAAAANADTRDDIEALVAGIADSSVANRGVLRTGANGSTETATGLDIGLYLVVETAAPPQVTTPANPFLVSVPILEETNGVQSWDYDVVAQPKNDVDDVPPTPDKTVDGDTDNDDAHSASVGDVLSFTLKTNVKEQFGTLDKLTFIDTMTKGLTLADQNGAAVTNLTSVAGSTNIFEVKGTRRDDGQVENIAVGDSGHTFAAETVASDGSTKLTINFVNADYIKTTYSEVTVGYKAIINDDAIVKTNPETNTFDLEYGNYTDIESDIVEITTYAFDLLKVGENETPLANAKFQIFESKEKAEKGEEPIEFLDAATDGNITKEAESNANGIVGFYGLAKGTYWIAETKAPTGYTLLKAPIEIHIDENTGTGSGDITVVNTRGFDLPETGGMGTVIFTIGGIVLMLGAAVLLVRSNKKSKAN